MPKTYCGKSCSECEYKEQLHCPGCKNDPGHETIGDCAIARCCQSSRKESCHGCSGNGRCATQAECHRIPEDKIRCQTAEAERKAEAAVRARGCVKLFWILFWVIIASDVAALLTSDIFIDPDTPYSMIGQIISLLFTVACAVIIWKLGAVVPRYRIASICYVVLWVVEAAYHLLDEPTLYHTVIFIIIAFIASILHKYSEYTAHASVLDGVDDKLAKKWRKLFKLQFWPINVIGLAVAMFIVLPFSEKLILSFYGLLLIAEIFTLVLTIISFVYFYISAKRLQACVDAQQV